MVTLGRGRRYTLVAILLHWTSALGILALIGMGLAMTHAGLAPLRQFQVYQWHKSVGITVLALTALRVADLMKRDPVTVPEVSRFTDIATSFLTNRYNYLFVVGEGRRFAGAISLHDVKNYLNDPELASIVIARDIVQEQFPSVAEDESLTDALSVFSRHDGERLPVTSNFTDRTLVGSISKSDVLLALSEQSQPLSSTHEAAVQGEAVEMEGEV